VPAVPLETLNPSETIMERRNFFKNLGAVGLGSAAIGLLPKRLLGTTEVVAKTGPAVNAALVGHTKRILTMSTRPTRTRC
jgi:hypothetical protein